MREIR